MSHPTLCYSMVYTVCGILQARTLEWVAFPFSRGSSQPRDGTQSLVSGYTESVMWINSSSFVSVETV